MADRKTGPVKAPTIEGNARPLAGGPAMVAADAVADGPDADRGTSLPGEPAPAPFSADEPPFSPAPPEATIETPATTADETVERTDPPRAERPFSSSSARAEASSMPPSSSPVSPRASRTSWILPALAGAVLGTGLTYLLGTVYPLPGPPVPDRSAELAALGKRLDSLEGNLNGVSSASTKTQQGLEQTAAQLTSSLSDLDKKVAALGTATPPSVDLSPIQDDLKALGSRVDALASGASGADAQAMSSRLASVENSVTAVSGKLDGITGDVSSLRTNLSETRDTLTAQIAADPTGPAVKLSVLLSSLESAFASGQPFTAELANLQTLQPPPDVPAVLKNAAPSGLSRPDILMQRFETVLPQMLAARQPTTSDWGSGALDWVKGLLAIRPIAQTEGDSPDAVASRLEAAMSRHDYADAAKLLALLPEPMRQVAGSIAEDIAVHAAADRLLGDLRGQALIAAEKTS